MSESQAHVSLITDSPRVRTSQRLFEASRQLLEVAMTVQDLHPDPVPAAKFGVAASQKAYTAALVAFDPAFSTLASTVADEVGRLMVKRGRLNDWGAVIEGAALVRAALVELGAGRSQWHNPGDGPNADLRECVSSSARAQSIPAWGRPLVEAVFQRPISDGRVLVKLAQPYFETRLV